MVDLTFEDVCHYQLIQRVVTVVDQLFSVSHRPNSLTGFPARRGGKTELFTLGVFSVEEREGAVNRVSVRP